MSDNGRMDAAAETGSSEQGPGAPGEVAEVLSNEGTQPQTVLSTRQPSNARRAALVGAVVAAVLGVGVGAVAVGNALSGGGTQPESVVPASAVLYAEIDLDPDAGQQVLALRFLSKFPGLADTLTADGSFGSGFTRMFDGSSLDYAKDVEPWLGRRYAVAVLPPAEGSESYRFQVILQSTDDDAAMKSLTEALQSTPTGPRVDVAVSDGYAIVVGVIGGLSPDGSSKADASMADEVAAEAARANLADAPVFASDVAPYGDGIALAWVDNAGYQDAMQSVSALGGLPLAGLALPDETGSAVSVLRFEDSALELVGHQAGGGVTVSGAGLQAFGRLPDDTLLAFGGADLGTYLQAVAAPALEQLKDVPMLGMGTSSPALSRAEIKQLCKSFPKDEYPKGYCESQFSGGGSAGLGFGGPGDGMFGTMNDVVTDADQWPTLFGDELVVAAGGGTDEPSVGLRVIGSSDTVSAINDLVELADDPVATQVTEDGVVVASDQAWAQALAGSGSFAESAILRDAVPDLDSAAMVGFVDVAGLLARYGADLDDSARANLAPIRAVGMSVTADGDRMTYRVRLLTS